MSVRPALAVCTFRLAYRHLTRDDGVTALCGLNATRAGRAAVVLDPRTPVTCPKCAREAVARGLLR